MILERDGRLGLAVFQQEKFDLCLLDVMMPHMDGFTLAEEVRNINPDVPLFFLSAKTMKDDIIQGYRAGGADDYITKPFDSEVLLLKMSGHTETQLEELNRESANMEYDLGRLFSIRKPKGFPSTERPRPSPPRRIALENVV